MPVFILVSNTGGIVLAHLYGDTCCPTLGRHLIVTSTGGLTITTFRAWSVLVLLACLGAVALHAPQATAEALSVFRGATYLITITDAQGAFASRAVIALHSDRTLPLLIRAKGGPPSPSAVNWARGNPTA